MASPFYVEGPVPPTQAPQHLFARDRERAELAHALQRGRPPHRVLTGPRGRGKTSLANAILHDVGERVPHIGLDLERVSPLDPWAVLSHVGEPWGPEWTAQAAAFRTRRDWTGLLSAFRQRALRERPPLLVLDNAQDLARLPRPFAQAWIETLAGLRRMPLLFLADARIDLLAAFEVYALEPFRADDARDFLTQRLQRAGVRPQADVVDAVLEFARGEPELLQRIGHALWERARLENRPEITSDDLAEILSLVLERLSPERAARYGAIRGQTRDLLVAMALHDEHNPTALARRVGVEPKNAVVLLARAAKLFGVLERERRGTYRFQDPLFEAYLKKQYANPRF